MNPATHVTLGAASGMAIRARLSYRADKFTKLRDELRSVIRMTGRLNASEAQDFLCCIAECMGSDLQEVKAAITDLSVDLDGIVHYGEDE